MSNTPLERSLRRRNFLAGAASTAVGAAALPLVGCGDDDDDDDGNGGTTTTTSVPPGQGTATASATAEPKRGGTWRRGAGGNIALASLPCGGTTRRPAG